MTNASPFKLQVCHSIYLPLEIQTGWTPCKYNGCVWTGFWHSHCQCQLQEGIQCPQEDHVRLEVSVGHYDGRFTTFGICWGCLRNTMRTPCSKDGGMVHRGDKDLRSRAITRTRKRIMIHSLKFSSVSHKYEHLSSFFYIFFSKKKDMMADLMLLHGCLSLQHHIYYTIRWFNKWCYQGQTSMHMGGESFAKMYFINHIDVRQYNLSLKLMVITRTANLVPSHSHQASATQMEIY